MATMSHCRNRAGSRYIDAETTTQQWFGHAALVHQTGWTVSFFHFTSATLTALRHQAKFLDATSGVFSHKLQGCHKI